MKSFRRNIKAISPIFATLILIAIAVIAGIVVYVFVSGAIPGFTGSSVAAQEKVAVQSFAMTASTGAVTAYAQSTNGLDVYINAITVKDSSGATVGTLPITAVQLKSDGTLTQVTGTVSLTPTGVAGNYYSVILTSTKGGSFASASGPAT